MDVQQLHKRQFEQFRHFIYDRSGIWINDNKVTLLSNRIRRRLQAGAFADYDAYYRHLTSCKGTDELEYFLDAITTNETYFFRTAPHFEWFSSAFISQVTLAAQRGDREKTLRIWSAGCANGAEPYSIAICLLKNAIRLRGWSLKVLGTDISEAELQQARTGSFRARAVGELPERHLQRYFRPDSEEGQFVIREAVRQIVAFEQHNLMNPMPRCFDCIFIRNVLIYFDRQSKRRVIDHLIAALAPGGHLVIGPSEGIYDMLEGLQKRKPFLYQKPDSPAARTIA